MSHNTQTEEAILLFGASGTIGNGIKTICDKIGFSVLSVLRKESAGREGNHINFEEFVEGKTNTDKLQDITTVVSCIGGFIPREHMASASEVTDDQISAMDAIIFTPNRKVYQQTCKLVAEGHMKKLKRFIFITGTNGDKPEHCRYTAMVLADAKLRAFLRSTLMEKHFQVVELCLGLKFAKSEVPNKDQKKHRFASSRLGKVFYRIMKGQETAIIVTDESQLDSEDNTSESEDVQNERDIEMLLSVTTTDNKLKRNYEASNCEDHSPVPKKNTAKINSENKTSFNLSIVK